MLSANGCKSEHGFLYMVREVVVGSVGNYRIIMENETNIYWNKKTIKRALKESWETWKHTQIQIWEKSSLFRDYGDV